MVWEKPQNPQKGLEDAQRPHIGAQGFRRPGRPLSRHNGLAIGVRQARQARGGCSSRVPGSASKNPWV